jgi:hypothetical protein
MRKFFPLLLCLSLSIFAVARATKPAQIRAWDTKRAHEEATRQEADTKPLLKESNTDEELGSDDDENMDDVSGDKGEDTNDDDGRGAAGDEGTGGDDAGDDNGGDDEGDDGGGDEGE